MANRRTFVSTAALGLLGSAILSVSAAALTVDGNLADWNVNVVDTPSGSGDNPTQHHNSTFGNVALTSGFRGVFVEDTNDRSNNYYVSPNYGGQNYDVEFMAAAVQGNRLYLAISSGIRPDNGPTLYGPGDIRIVVNGTVKYGIEIGGGAGHTGGPASAAIQENANGTTYALDGNGHTTGSANAAAAQKAGTIWKNVTWIADPIDGSDETQFAINGGSEQVGVADYVYTLDSSTSQHAFIELSLLLSDIGDISADTFELQWGPTCGNDVADLVIAPSPRDIDVPAPAALPLFLFGVGGLMALRRRLKAA